MENYIETLSFKRERLRHVMLNNSHLIAFPLCNLPFSFALLCRKIQNSTYGTLRRKNGDLLTTTTGQAQQLFPIQFPKLKMWYKFGRCQANVPTPLQSFQILLMGNGLTGSPAVPTPHIYGFCIDFLIVHRS